MWVFLPEHDRSYINIDWRAMKPSLLRNVIVLETFYISVNEALCFQDDAMDEDIEKIGDEELEQLEAGARGLSLVIF